VVEAFFDLADTIITVRSPDPPGLDYPPLGHTTPRDVHNSTAYLRDLLVDRAAAVSPGDYLQVVACRVIEVDAATPVVPVDLTWVLLTRVGPVRDPAFLDSPEDGVKVIFADQERVVLSREIDAWFGVVERQIRAEVDSQEEPGWFRIIEPEELGKEVRRLTLVVCRDEKMIELYCHARPLGTPTPPSAG
jgi:hypothetical protein